MDIENFMTEDSTTAAQAASTTVVEAQPAATPETQPEANQANQSFDDIFGNFSGTEGDIDSFMTEGTTPATVPTQVPATPAEATPAKPTTPPTDVAAVVPATTVSEVLEREQTTYTNLALDLKDSSIIDFDLPEGEKLDKLKFDALIQNNVKEQAMSIVKGLDDDAKAFMRYKLNGGDTSVFLKAYQQSTTDTDLSTVDVTNTAAVQNAVKEFYKDTVTDPVLAERLYNTVKDDTAALTTDFNKAKTHFANKKEETRQALLVQAKNAEIAATNAAAEMYTGLQGVAEKGEVVSYKLTPAEQRTLPVMVAHKNVVLSNGNKVSELQSKIINLYSTKDYPKLLALAKFFKDDLKAASVKDVTTNVTNNVETTLSRVLQGKSVGGENAGNTVTPTSVVPKTNDLFSEFQ